jgi:hypothetical protein
MILVMFIMSVILGQLNSVTGRVAKTHAASKASTQFFAE